ncbi:MAG: hypothetical protein M3377_08905 [Actinomycetota bacterium]|nr:hypothetical protein [Actinomycetota bacterium]
MSADERREGDFREPASYTVAGYMAAAALFAGLLALIWYPGRIGPAAILVALVAAAMGGPQRRLAAFALAAATTCWFTGMILAVVLGRPIF